MVRPALNNGELGRRLYDAIVAGDRALVEQMIAGDARLLTTAVSLPPGSVPSAGNDGDLLTFAVARCDPQMLGLLLRMGARPDAVKAGMALTYALLADQPLMAEMLLQAGASPDPVGNQGRAPFGEMLAYRNPGGVTLLLRHGLRVDRVDALGNSYLHDATAVQNFVIAELLVERGANLWLIGLGGRMPVHRLVAGPSPDATQEAARQRLLAKAQASGLPWPPPTIVEVRQAVAEGQWPTPAMREAGMGVSPAAIESIKRAHRPQ